MKKALICPLTELLPIGLFFQRTECVLWSVNMTHGPLGYSAGGKYYKENKITKVLTHLQMYNVESEIWIWIQIVVVAVFPHGNSFTAKCDVWNIFCTNWAFISQNILIIVLTWSTHVCSDNINYFYLKIVARKKKLT